MLRYHVCAIPRASKVHKAYNASHVTPPMHVSLPHTLVKTTQVPNGRTPHRHLLSKYNTNIIAYCKHYTQAFQHQRTFWQRASLVTYIPTSCNIAKASKQLYQVLSPACHHISIIKTPLHMYPTHFYSTLSTHIQYSTAHASSQSSYTSKHNIFTIQD